VVAAVAGPALARAGLLARRRAYRHELVRAAPAVARSLADALAAGHAVRGAVAAAADGVAGPARVELRRAAAALALGEPTGAALETLRTRAGAAPWDAMVAGILLQRDAGGDLTGLLRDLAESLEATVRAERDARAATAQARATARTVAGLPVAAAVLAELASPGFLSGLVATPLSAALVALAAVLQLAGAAAVRALARVGR
jgi:tight adherence protein B